MNNHSMTTRSKSTNQNIETITYESEEYEEIDSHNNLIDLIDDSEINKNDDKKAFEELNIVLDKSIYTPRKKNKKVGNYMNDMLMSLLVMKANQSLKEKRKKKKKKKSKKKEVIVEIIQDEDSLSETSDQSEKLDVILDKLDNIEEEIKNISESSYSEEESEEYSSEETGDSDKESEEESEDSGEDTDMNDFKVK